MRKNRSSRFFANLTNKQIDHLILFSSKPCSVCFSAHEKYFCVDKECKRNALVCGQCSQSNIHYLHYQHQIVYLKQFLTKEKYLTMNEIVGKYEKFVNLFSQKVNDFRSSLGELEQWEKKMLENLSEMKNLLQSSGFLQMEEKLHKITEKPTKNQKKTSLQEIFENYRYFSPNELLKRIKKFDSEEVFYNRLKVIEKTFQDNKIEETFQRELNVYSQFKATPLREKQRIEEMNGQYLEIKNFITDNFEHSFLKISLNSFHQYIPQIQPSMIEKKICTYKSSLLYLMNVAQNSDHMSELNGIDQNLNSGILSEFSSFSNKGNEINNFLKEELLATIVTGLNKVKILQLDFPVSSYMLNNIFVSIPSLTEIQFDQGFKSEQRESFEHKCLEVIQFNYDFELPEKLLKIFFNSELFPAFKKVKILHCFETYSSEHDRRLVSLLRQNFQNIEVFHFKRFIEEKSQCIKNTTKEKIIQVISSNKFKQIRLFGAELDIEQKLRYKNTLKANSNLLSLITDVNMEINQEKAIFYAIAKYQKYKNCSKKVFVRIVQHILV